MTPARIEDQYTNEPGTAQTKHRLRKRAKGLCGVHGCHVFSGPKSRCPGHEAEAKVYGAAYRANKTIDKT